MLKRWVDSLFLGTWHLPSGDVFECTPEARDYYFARSKEFFKSGIPLPVCLEHQPTVGLSFHDRLAEQTKHTIGHCHDVRVGESGQLQYLVDGDDEAFQIMRRNKYVSPEIRQNVIDTRTGKRFQGPSVVHLAVTPRPIQVTGKSHFSLSAAKDQKPVRLDAIAVDVSLSAAAFKPKDKSMADKKKPDDTDKPDDLEALEDDAPAADGMDDVNLGDVTAPAVPPPAAGGDEAMDADEAKAMAELEHEISELGIEFHDSASGSLLTHLQHLITALKTHKSTKAGGVTPAEPDPNEPDPNQPDPNTPQEPEVAESAPIMMSQNTLTPREQKAVAKILKDAKPGVLSRIKAVHVAGYIDDTIKKELEGELGTIKLSASDLNDDFELKPLPVTFKLDMLERLVKSGKPGPFAKAPAKAPVADPNKPISSAVALSAANDEVEEPSPYPKGDEHQTSRAKQEAAGDELAALAGYPTRR